MGEEKAKPKNNTECIEHVNNALSWANAARDELLDALSTAAGHERGAIVSALTDAIGALTDSMEPVRAILGLPPEALAGADYDDEEDD